MLLAQKTLALVDQGDGALVLTDIFGASPANLAMKTPATGAYRRLVRGQPADAAGADLRKSENIAGYYAWFKLLTGFRKELFMTTAEVENHARKYSTAYRYDLVNKKGSKVDDRF